MNKKNITISDEHKLSLAKTREIITDLINKLEGVIKDAPLANEPENWRYLWGDKENVVSALTKLTSLLIKIIPIEKDMDLLDDSIDSEEIISESDREILQIYLQRQKDKWERGDG